jgi:hypothetical protein
MIRKRHLWENDHKLSRLNDFYYFDDNYHWRQEFFNRFSFLYKKDESSPGLFYENTSFLGVQLLCIFLIVLAKIVAKNLHISSPS